VLAVMNVYISVAPGSSNIFALGQVPAKYWFIPIPLALGLLVMDEMRKLYVRRFPKSWVAKAAW
jgi:sodium/potassium-transporting ATPase subunit alpha